MDLSKYATDYCCGIFSLFWCAHFSCTVSSIGSEHAEKDDFLTRFPQAKGNIGYFLYFLRITAYVVYRVDRLC